MKKFTYLSLLFAFACSSLVRSQKTDANIFGDVQSNGEHLPYASVYLKNSNIGVTTDETGHYMLTNLPVGEQVIVAQMVGYEKQEKTVNLNKNQSIELNFELNKKQMNLNEVVVTGTKTFKRQTESPVIVNVLDKLSIQMLEANTLSESLSFQPGLRMETNCQTCNYSQLRMNGLGGGYSQILINSRPVFSPLTGLYGLEQIPSNMIERIEVVRGGGSSLYGSSAIGGTVNVITSTPSFDNYNVSFNHGIINGEASDQKLNASASVVNQNRNAGASFFTSRRERGAYDHNNDGYSELPELQNNSFGVNSFLKPSPNQKIEFNFSSIYEYRYGGELIEGEAYQAEQSEEREHNIFMGGLDYEIDFNNEKNRFIAYFALQNTQRHHYTGIIPDENSEGYENHFVEPPYGNTDNTTMQAGAQFNHKAYEFLGGTNQFTLGADYVYDDIVDRIPAYEIDTEPFTDQTTRNSAVFIQSDLSFTNGLNLLTGIRADRHNLVDEVILSPRIAFLYKLKQNTQIRLSWARGFRAPQAFDSDLHIEFAAGGISRVVLADNLNEERSNSFSASVNYDKPTEKYIWGLTVEGFYTNLEDAFALVDIGEDRFGQIKEKRNVSGSVVQGATLELRANYNKIMQLEAGITIQQSRYETKVQYSDALPSLKKYLRTPDEYGYVTFTLTPGERFNASLSAVYTGPMTILHLAGAPEQNQDAYVTTDPFYEMNVKLAYSAPLRMLKNELEIFAGVKNIFNEYQDDFDTGKNRDSNYIYGPAAPRTLYAGLSLKLN